MTGPHVAFKLPTGLVVRVAPGGIIGRTSSASLRLPDPRVSEAHALVSLRGREFRILALRGRTEVDGEEETEVIAAPGQRLTFGGAITVEIDHVEVGDRVLAVEFGGELRELCADSYSVVAGPPPDLLPRFVADALAWIWSTDDGWMLSDGSSPPRRMSAGITMNAGELQFSTVLVAPSGSGSTTGGPSPSITLVCRTTTVHIHQRSRLPVTVDARAGLLLSELALMRAPAPWAAAAGLLWPDQPDAHKLRRNFDAVIARLRTRLREAGVREDLIRTDGRGNVEVFLHPGDEVVDEA